MKFKIFALAAAMLVGQAFAFIGFGVHYAPSFNTKLDASKGFSDVTPEKLKEYNIPGAYETKIEYFHEGMNEPMIHGLGFKIWLDSISIVDIEATVNLQYGSYDAKIRTEVTKPTLDLLNPLETITREDNLQIDMSGTPFGTATPKFVAMNGDLSVTFPFLTSLITLVRPYVGAGVTVFMNTFVMDDEFISDLVNDEEFQNMLANEVITGATDKAEEDAKKKAQMVMNKVKEQAKKQTLNYTIGGHAILGARFRFPYIPLAMYINGKYYFGEYFSNDKHPDEITPGHFAAEAGIGLSF
ncbi:MAG: hypothetical protein MJZ05_09200 [Fibrobacter sp.]|nr:hypothetical protein [Fibrobacter sp.]